MTMDPQEQQAPSADGFPADDVWRRLSTRMLLIHPVKELIRFLPALIAVVIAGSTGGQKWWGLIGVAIAVGLGLLRWLTTRYRFTPDQVQLRHGLLNTTTVSAPIDRVRSVDVTASILHRALGLAEVKIGTGAGEKELKLDGLTAAEAAALRGDLLHRSRAQAAGGSAARGTVSNADAADQPDPAGRQPPSYSPETVVYQLNPSWIRYAPFSPAGLIAALAIFGIGSQVINESGIDWGDNGVVNGAADFARGLGVLAAIVVGLLALVVFVVLLSLGGYLLAFHNFRLTRDDAGGTHHVTRGLLTTRATSLEIRRLRGVALHRPVPLRWVGGARLEAITTGVKDDDRTMSTTLTPPSPAPVVTATATRVLGDPHALEQPLQPHGPAATRRRYTRALVGFGIPAAALVAAATVWSLPALVIPAVLLLVLGVLLGRSRARWLGHAITDRFLITRSGSLALATDVVERRSAVGVVVRRSFFQRRARLATVSLATAAGAKAYPVIDVPQQQVGELAGQLLPETAEQFLRDQPPTTHSA
ncbi:PH domain-containing protein [Flexivirga meconopsidis]|uniref:PH domain-containing protein n=1 Tax=Flexivirga meconopsidis TaxID=2977121 RepID=UPI00223FDE9D|nr:PH domain-containing protein [Flexivirga meconopsidis]